MTRLRASELSSYAFCERAWWYARQGVPSENAPALDAGTAWHRRHGRQVLAGGCLRTVGYLLILAALVGAAVYLTVVALG